MDLSVDGCEGREHRGIARLVVDLDAAPEMPKGLVGIKKHIPGGRLVVPRDLRFISPHREPEQEADGRCIKGVTLSEKLECLSGVVLLNAVMLDFFLIHQHFIPPEWKRLNPFFFGTEYYGPEGERYVRGMKARGGLFYDDFRLVDDVSGFAFYTPVPVVSLDR